MCRSDQTAPGLDDGYVAESPRWSGHDRLVPLSGCSGGGKSALAAELAARGHRAFPEPGRQVEEEGLIGDVALPWIGSRRFAERCIAQAAYFFNVAHAAAGPVFFDRDIIDAVTTLERLGEVPAAFAEALTGAER